MASLAVVAAGGSGSRFGGTIKKQFLELYGTPLYIISLVRLKKSGLFDEIRLVVPDDDRENTWGELKSAGLDDIVLRRGGATRQESVKNGLRGGCFDFVAIHDAARPFFSIALLRAGMEAVQISPCVIPVTAIADTVKAVKGGNVLATLDRGSLKAVQTPQFFDYGMILGLHDIFSGGDHSDDARLFELKKLPVKTIIGDKFNFKITTNDDMILAEALFRKGAVCIE